MNKNGFTILELMVVLVIIAALASVALPAYHEGVMLQYGDERVVKEDVAKSEVADFYRTKKDSDRASAPKPVAPPAAPAPASAAMQ